MKGGLEDATVVLENSAGGLTRFRKAVLATLCALKLKAIAANVAPHDAPAGCEGAEALVTDGVYFEKNFTKDSLL
jgi:hypothetical protein